MLGSSVKYFLLSIHFFETSTETFREERKRTGQSRPGFTCDSFIGSISFFVQMRVIEFVPDEIQRRRDLRLEYPLSYLFSWSREVRQSIRDISWKISFPVWEHVWLRLLNRSFDTKSKRAKAYLIESMFDRGFFGSFECWLLFAWNEKKKRQVILFAMINTTQQDRMSNEFRHYYYRR